MTCILKSLWPLNANFPPQSRHLLGFSYKCRLVLLAILTRNYRSSSLYFTFHYLLIVRKLALASIIGNKFDSGSVGLGPFMYMGPVGFSLYRFPFGWKEDSGVANSHQVKQILRVLLPHTTLVYFFVPRHDFLGFLRSDLHHFVHSTIAGPNWEWIIL